MLVLFSMKKNIVIGKKTQEIMVWCYEFPFQKSYLNSPDFKNSLSTSEKPELSKYIA